MNSDSETTHLESIGIFSRLARQLHFIREVDALKEIWRKTVLINGKRVENDAEHSWEMALMAAVLAEHMPAHADLRRVITMLLIHDLVEIDAGDTFVYDAGAQTGQQEREQQAAKRIFGLLPDDQAGPLCALWQEFEARVTPDARFARAIDRLQPLLHSYHTRGKSWRENRVNATQVRKVMAVIRDGSAGLGDLSDRLIADAVAQGFLAPE